MFPHNFTQDMLVNLCCFSDGTVFYRFLNYNSEPYLGFRNGLGHIESPKDSLVYYEGNKRRRGHSVESRSESLKALLWPSSFPNEPFVLSLNYAIAFTTRLFESASIQYLDFPTGITNETRMGENASGDGDAGSACT